MKIWYTIKVAVYLILATLLAVFAREAVDVINYVVGGLMLVYGLETVILEVKNNDKLLFDEKVYWGANEVLIGVLMIAILDDTVTVLVAWAVWSILRETWEIKEVVLLFKERLPAYLNVFESVVVIVLSVVMIIVPNEHSALVHVYLLVSELCLTAVLPKVYELLRRKKQKVDNV